MDASRNFRFFFLVILLGFLTAAEAQERESHSDRLLHPLDSSDIMSRSQSSDLDDICQKSFSSNELATKVPPPTLYVSKSSFLRHKVMRLHDQSKNKNKNKSDCFWGGLFRQNVKYKTKQEFSIHNLYKNITRRKKNR